jgi:hypothetical protein
LEEEKFVVSAGIQAPDYPNHSIIIYYILRLLVGYSMRNSLVKFLGSELDVAVIYKARSQYKNDEELKHFRKYERV